MEALQDRDIVVNLPLFTHSPRFPDLARGLVLLVLAWGVACSPQRLARGDLQLRTLLEREIGVGESHTYRLPLEAGEFVQLRIHQPLADVTAKLVSPTGEEVPLFNDPRPLEEPDRLDWIAKAGGAHRLTVSLRWSDGRQGRYRIELRELRRSEPADTEQVAAENIYREARSVLVENESEETRRRSLRTFEKALRQWERAGDALGQVDSLVQIAEIYNALGESQAAIEPGERALDLARRADYQGGEGRALQSLGNAYTRLGEWGKALGLYESSLKIWEDGRDVDRQGTVLRSMGIVFTRQRQLNQAAEYLRRALPFLQSAGDLNGKSWALATLGGLQTELGNTAEALKSLEQALVLSEKTSDAATRALALFNLGRCHKLRGEFEAALRAFSEARDINVRLGARDNEAYSRQAVGSVYFNLGNPEKALEEYGKALQLSQEIDDPDLEARLLTNTGWIYQDRGDLKAALDYYSRALALNRDRENPLSATHLALNNTGVAYVKRGSPEEGLSFLLQALQLRIQKHERASQAGTLLEIGTAYQSLRRFDQAANHFRQALDLARQTGNTGLQAESLFRWAVLDREAGRLEDALARIRESLDIIESVRSRVVDDKLRMSFFATKRAYYEFYVQLLMQLEDLHVGRYGTEALEASERARTRSLLDLLAESQINVHQDIDPILREKEKELAARLSLLEDQLGRQDPGDAARLAALKEQLEQARNAMERLESDIRSRHQLYAEVRYPKPLRLEQIRALLDERTALLEYFVGKDGSFLFVVTRQGLGIHRLPPKSEIFQDVERLRALLQKRGRRTLAQYQALSYRLFTRLVGPATNDLERKPRLLIAPDGALYLLPFEALLTQDRANGRSFRDLAYLLRDYTVSYIPSASVLAGLRKPRSLPAARSAKLFLAFGDPVYGSLPADLETVETSPASLRAAEGGLERLPGSAMEVQRIAALYPAGSVSLYLGARATEDNVKRNPVLATARRIHFATHGTLNEERPDQSGLALARDVNSREDGLLQVREIFNLRLNADLLTLSACETALGKEVTGEGMIGLTRAFLYAGARSLLVSLWPVPDHSTQDLMFDFYEGLGSSQEKTEALRQAKLAMIQGGDFSEPYYWAPFILAGNPR